MMYWLERNLLSELSRPHHGSSTYETILRVGNHEIAPGSTWPGLCEGHYSVKNKEHAIVMQYCRNMPT